MGNDHPNGNIAGNGTRTERALRVSELSNRRLFEAAHESHTPARASPRQGITSRRSTVPIIDRKCKDFRHAPKPSKTTRELNFKSALFGGFFARFRPKKRDESALRHDSGIIIAPKLWFPKSFGFCKPDFAGK